MPNPVRAIPEGYHSISPSLTCKNAARAIEFYKSVFGATEVMRMPGPEGKIMHAELKIGDSIIFVNDEFPGMAEAQPLASRLPCLCSVHRRRGLRLQPRRIDGSMVVMPLENMFWGDRYGKVTDPFGHQWGIASTSKTSLPRR